MTRERAGDWQDARSPEALVLTLVHKGIEDKRLLDAFTQIHRADFVPAQFGSNAYEDEPIDIGHNQVTTQPSLIALMVQALHLTGLEKVLEVGTGFGFQTAILSRVCRQVFSIERFADLAAMAESNLRKAGIQNAKVIAADGTLGLPDDAPFEAIIVSAAAIYTPEPLVQQLMDGGRLVQPIGPGGREIVTSFQKYGGRLVKTEEITGAYFVPLFIGGRH